MTYPATIGASRPVKFARQLVNAIKIPANRGDRSKWLTYEKKNEWVLNSFKWLELKASINVN